jgi:hypothetical protein
MQGIAAKLDDIGKPAWIALMVVSFIIFWPAGLAVLAYLIGSGRMACWKQERRWRRHEMRDFRHHMREQMRAAADRWFGDRRNGEGDSERDRERYYGPTSGNAAFDEYRAETLRRLEDEEREFRDFLARLRVAKDKQEFDEFLNQRRRRPEGQGPEPQPQA